MRVTLCIYDTLADAGILLLFSADKVCVMDPLVRCLIVRKSCSSGDRLEEISSCSVKGEYLLSVEAQIFPGTEYGASFARERLHVRYPLKGLSLLS